MLSAVRCLRAVRSARPLHTSATRSQITNLTMPALSPTMTEGTISEWKVKEGESFVAGDILLAMETDKASIDVEAQDDGIMGKIILPDGSAGVQVGKVIALLAEEGDDISNLEAPSESSSSSPPPPKSESKPEPPSQKEETSASASSTPPPPKSSTPTGTSSSASSTEKPHHGEHPTHARPLLPSVMRALMLGGVKDTDKITATGPKGMLTKGDVLAYLGKIKSARGSEKAEDAHSPAPSAPAKKAEPLSGAEIRRLVAFGLSAPKPKSLIHDLPALDFDAVMEQYLPSAPKAATPPTSSPSPPRAAKDPFDAVLGL